MNCKMPGAWRLLCHTLETVTPSDVCPRLQKKCQLWCLCGRLRNFSGEKDLCPTWLVAQLCLCSQWGLLSFSCSAEVVFPPTCCRWDGMGWDGMCWDEIGGLARRPLRCTLPTAEDCREEFGCQALTHRIHIPSGAVHKTILSQGVWRESGTVRVNEHNCKDCPKTDGKQRPNGIENRCEA